ncbi:MAG TPA: tetratricopeptide repeat protein, partial [Thermoanaerobaculia bacterium]
GDVAAKRQVMIATAQSALAKGDNVTAADQFGKADRLAKLQGPEAEQMATAQRRLEPIAKPLTLFRQHDWEYALRDLWMMHEADPGNQDVTTLIVDSYYDLGVRDMQSGDLAKALEKFNEGLKLHPDDEMLERHRQFAQLYQTHPKDLLYRIYVKYIPPR